MESIAYVGIELRRLGDLLEREGSTPPLEAPFVFRSLAELQPPAPILIVGSAGRPVGASLASFGYEVTVVDEPLTDWDAGDLSFKAVLRVGESDQPDPSMLKRIDGLLARDGILVVSMPFGFSEGPTPAGYDPEAISKLLSDWNVAEHTVIAECAGEATGRR